MRWSTHVPQEDGYVLCVDNADFSIYIQNPLTVTGTGFEFEMVSIRHTRRATGRKAKQALKKMLVDACKVFSQTYSE